MKFQTTRILLLKDVFATVAELQSVYKYLLDILLKNSILKMEPLQKSIDLEVILNGLDYKWLYH